MTREQKLAMVIHHSRCSSVALLSCSFRLLLCLSYLQISAQSPELLSLVEELKDVVHELDHKINPIKTLVTEVRVRNSCHKIIEILLFFVIPRSTLAQACKSSADVDDDLVDYLEAKQQLLYSYCVNMTFYLYMKVPEQILFRGRH